MLPTCLQSAVKKVTSPPARSVLHSIPRLACLRLLAQSLHQKALKTTRVGVLYGRTVDNLQLEWPCMLCATGVADIHTAGIPTRAAGHPVALCDEWPIQGCILDHASVTAGTNSIDIMRMSSCMPFRKLLQNYC